MKPVLPALVAIAALLGVQGCGAQDDRAEGSSQDASQTKVANAKRDAVDPQKAVYHIRARFDDHKAEGTGFVYDAKEGLVLTANHFLEGARTIILTGADGRPVLAEPVARAQCRDLTVLRLRPKPADLVALPFADSDTVRAGETVTSLSFPLPSAEGLPQLAVTRGTTAATDVKVELHPLLPSFAPLIAHQTPLTPVASGSPLLNARNQVIGVNTLVDHARGEGTVEGYQYAQAANYVRNRLTELRPGATDALVGWQNEHRCHHKIFEIQAEGHGDSATGAAASQKDGSKSESHEGH